MSVNWIVIFNRVFEIINPPNREDECYFSGVRFISKVREIDPYFPDYGQYLNERKRKEESTSRKDYFYDILLGLDESARLQVINSIIEDVESCAPDKVAELRSVMSGIESALSPVHQGKKSKKRESFRVSQSQGKMKRYNNIVELLVDYRTYYKLSMKEMSRRLEVYIPQYHRWEQKREKVPARAQLAENAGIPFEVWLHLRYDLPALYDLKTGEYELLGSQKTEVTPTEALRVFLCHAKEDKQSVVELYDRLANDGVHPWLDEKDLLPGQDWDLKIRQAIQNSGVVIVCLSKKSTSKRGYVQKEIKVALDTSDHEPEGTIYIIPVRLEECVVPDRLSGIQWVDLYRENGYANLLEALKVRASELGVNPPQINKLNSNAVWKIRKKTSAPNDVSSLAVMALRKWVDHGLLPEPAELCYFAKMIQPETISDELLAFVLCSIYARYEEVETWSKSNEKFSVDHFFCHLYGDSLMCEEENEPDWVGLGNLGSGVYCDEKGRFICCLLMNNYREGLHIYIVAIGELEIIYRSVPSGGLPEAWNLNDTCIKLLHEEKLEDFHKLIRAV